MAKPICIVGIGASAGGIEAFKGFFQAMPVPNGMGFVVVLHMAPDLHSMLPEVLARWTEMPVVQTADGMQVDPDHVYVIPPNQLLGIENGRLRLHTPLKPVREAGPIDYFFSSLAQDQGADAMGIVLSGTGSDGALGLKAIKLKNGIAFAQGTDGSGPQFSGMPSSAVATGVVDLIVPVEKMPRRILDLVAPANRPQDGAVNDPGAPEHEPDLEAHKQAICEILHRQVGHDFVGYKEQTFMRRVVRRIQFLGLDIAHYVERLRSDPHEVNLLFQDLLIGVTSFFRDEQTFAAVSEIVLPELFANKSATDTVRIWVPGCATGEEAYSLAILAGEYLSTQQMQPKLQIFATDIDEAAIAIARTGRYPALLLKDMPPERRDRFFSATEGGFVINKDIRDWCTFSAHSVIRDPPFSRIDMVSCRNLLIYLDTDLQTRVIPAFHYSLIPGGFLLLGGSETVTRHTDLFTPVDKKHRIFRRRAMETPPLQVAAVRSAHRMFEFTRPGPRPSAQDGVNPARLGNELALERFAPPFVVVDTAGDVLHFSGRTGRYLEPSPGTPTRNLISMARRGLRMDLRTALRKAQETGRPVEDAGVRVETDAGIEPLRLIVEPLGHREPERLYMVIFAELVDASPRPEPSAEWHRIPSPNANDHLERELRDAREDLQSVSESYETALEELKSANEELHSVNEELQSSNEELETSKEEIQSMNEELQTVNAQLVAKVDELDRAASDMRNLFESTQVATVFLDRFMIIRSFTPAMASIYNLIPSDHGRPLTDIVSQISYADLGPDMRQVLNTREPFERRVSRRDDATHFLMRILPYRASNNQVDGVLITFVDVTSVVLAEQQHRLLLDEMNHRVRNMLTVVISIASQTLRQTKSLDEFSQAFLGRVHALATAYTLLSRENWTGVSLRDVVEMELAPFVSENLHDVTVEGPSLLLSPRGALALGLVLHELATNAVKYGALSVPDGKLTIRWETTAAGPGARSNNRQVNFIWTEAGGPPVVPPKARGLGVALIERSLQYELRGQAHIVFAEEGLKATLEVPFEPALTAHAKQGSI